MRLLKYLNGSRELGLKLTADNYLLILAFVDASYGVHMDYKSHTGVTIAFGRGFIFTKSIKQKLNNKSSTEAELIAMSHDIGQVIWTRNFLINERYKINKAKNISR